MIGVGYQPKVRKVSLDKLIITPMGMFEPLCQSCVHKDCGNPIESKNMSIFGISKNWRLYVGPGHPMAVVECESYAKESRSTGE